MPRIRQQNVMAAQWAPNGGALGAPDLTSPDNQVFGENVFSPAIQRQRLGLIRTTYQPIRTAHATWTDGIAESWSATKPRP